MKLLDLPTTLIITLASSNVFARTFVCTDWREGTILYKNENKVIDGTMFIGQKKEKNKLIIKDDRKYLHELILLGASVKQEFYSSTLGYDPNPEDPRLGGVYGVDYQFKFKDYDFTLTQLCSPRVSLLHILQISRFRNL